MGGRPREDIDSIIELFNAGESVSDMAERLGLSVDQVYGRLKTAGLSIRKRDGNESHKKSGRAGGLARKRSNKAAPGHGYYLHDQRYDELQQLLRRYKSVTLDYDGLDYVCELGNYTSAPMRSVEAAIDSAKAASEERL